MRYIILLLFISSLTSCLLDENNNSTDLEIEYEGVAENSINAKEVTGKKSYDINDIEVFIDQKRVNDFACRSLVIINNKKNKEIDTIKITSEPVGGNFGLSCIHKLETHYVISKYGDYEGKTIIINAKGKIFEFDGGDTYYDIRNQLIFSVFSSDLNGLNVFDLKADSIIFSFDDTFDCRPSSFYYSENDRLLMLCDNYSESQDQVWEFEFDLNRVMQLDLTKQDLGDYPEIPKLTEDEILCKCKSTPTTIEGLR